MNYYEHHLGDYDADTAHLSLVEDAIYTRLIRLYYRTEKAIPADVAKVARLIRASDEAETVAAILAEFFTLADDGWHQKRCDHDIAKYQAKAERNREVGKLGGRPKKLESQQEPNGNPDGFQEEPTQNPNQTPDTRHQTDTEPTALVPGTAYRAPPAPSQEIVDLYRERLPMLPGVEVLNDSRKRAIAARWREVCTAEKFSKADALDWFGWYFGHVAKSPFLTGRIPGKSGRVWCADFDFLMNASKFPRVVEGIYHKESQ